MNARTFGNGDAEARVAARYAGIGGEEIAAAERQHQTDRSAWVAEQNRRYEERTQVPSTPAAAVRLASPAAVDYLVSLWLQRSDKATREQVHAWASQQDRAVVSAKIDWLKTQPKLASNLPSATVKPLGKVPAGRYAVTGERGQTVFVKVDRPTTGPYAGKTFVKIQAGSEYHKVSWTTAQGLLAKILDDDPEEACIRYGHELEHCGRCGRELTDPSSRAAGIGPHCASKGW